MGRARGVLLAAGSFAGAWSLARRIGFFRVAVRGDSMAPGLVNGDYLVATAPRRIVRGDVVVVRLPEREVVKRVIGLPGERVRLESGRVSVEGRSFREPYAHGAGPSGSWVLGPDEYVVLGDQRDRSTDGRIFGPVRADAIVGIVRFRYWPSPRIVRSSRVA
ncbi:MAG: signal peptidase I [Actinomycetota bacterium]